MPVLISVMSCFRDSSSDAVDGGMQSVDITSSGQFSLPRKPSQVGTKKVLVTSYYHLMQDRKNPVKLS